MNILGVSALYHDSAACFIRDGNIIAAAQEERFTRKKHDPGVPYNAMEYCLTAGDVKNGDLDVVVYYDKPISKFSRLLTTYSEVAPSGLKSFLLAVPVWLKEKAWVPYTIEKFLVQKDYGRPKEFLFTEHHLSHAASAFFPSPFDQAAILSVDGVGEWTTSAIAMGHNNSIEMLFEQRFPHSLGLLYSAFTYFTGFRVNSGEYKLMGLAPYGEPVYVDIIKDHLLNIREDGSFHLNMEYFGYLDGLKMTNKRFASLFNGPVRKAESEITKREMDLARSIQVVTEEILYKMARYARAVTGKKHLCLAGGVALNCVANGKLLNSGLFEDIWIQPAAGDAGGALGAALYVWYNIKGNTRKTKDKKDHMSGSFLGPEFGKDKTKDFLDINSYPYKEVSDSQRDTFIAKQLADGKVVGMLQGRMEFGPRALGNRSIIADARSPKMQSYLNLATKFRESFRPFAPVVLQEDVAEYFEGIDESPYMLLVANVQRDRWMNTEKSHEASSLKEWVNTPRSDIPAVTHVDYSARVQTIDRQRNPRMHSVISEFKKLTGSSVLINTSFNIRGEPIVCTPEDAYRCFMRTGIDILVLDNFVLEKDQQPERYEEVDWKKQFPLD